MSKFKRGDTVEHALLSIDSPTMTVVGTTENIWNPQALDVTVVYVARGRIVEEIYSEDDLVLLED